MRGTPGTRTPHGILARIIPAYAGNTDVWSRRATVSRDHPRVCGEHGRQTRGSNCVTGSSPRMRGTLCRQHHGSRHAGIIPAYAGNTLKWFPTAGLLGDHPRVCGEHLRFSTRAHIRQGSSPRMRGTLALSVVSLPSAGIIPAYAGNTSFSEFYNTVDRDHPRVCGEHINANTTQLNIQGSSPRMRGTRLHD